MLKYEYINLFKIVTNRDISRDIKLVATLCNVAMNVTINVANRSVSQPDIL